jgi:hypothetical protein
MGCLFYHVILPSQIPVATCAEGNWYLAKYPIIYITDERGRL